MSSSKRSDHVGDPRLCLGCGVCAYILPETKMIDIDHVGVRPRLDNHPETHRVKEARAACPTVSADYGELKRRDDYKPAVDKKTEVNWGAVTGIWEGHATDDEVRFKGSSGGALTALSQYCIEQLGFHGVLHTGENPEDPIRNRTRLSSTREDLVAAVGSRYSPASVCEGLQWVEDAPKPCAVIGKPVEIAATRNAMRLRPALAQKIGATLSFFCAETPPTKATRSLTKEVGVDEHAIVSLRYRGYGWPGYFTTQSSGDDPKEHWIYQKAWAYLQGFRPWAAHVWPDGSGELADISCGDPWYEEPDGKNPGFSLIVARTALGKEIVEGAIASGYLEASVAETWKLEKSQVGLLKKKGAVWGRRLVHRLMRMPNTEFRDLDLFSPWLELTTREKISSIFGTLRRVLQRRLWRI